MSTNKPTLAANHYYHFYNRGVNREQIFLQQENWLFFLTKVRQYFRPNLIDIIAYCLMPNHYHMLVYLKTDQISREVMQPFTTSYVKAINKQHGRVGPLFQSRFQAKHVDSGPYLAELTRYIHLNPVRAGLVDHPENWPYSSYNEYIGLRRGTLPHPETVMAAFSTPQAYRQFVEQEDPNDNPFHFP